jgi:hypothetical protein
VGMITLPAQFVRFVSPVRKSISCFPLVN